MDLEARAQFDPVRRLPKEHTRLVDYLRSKPEGEWSNPTNCTGWTVAHLVAHLIINAAFLGESVRTILEDSREPAPQDPPLPFGFPDLGAFEDWRTAETKRLLEGGKDGLLTEFEQTAADLQEQIGRIDFANTAIPFWHPSGEGRLGYIPTFRLFEVNFHEWDIRMKEDSVASLSDAALPLMTDRLPLMLGRYARLRTGPGSPAGRFRVLLTDPARNFLIDWRGKESRALVDDGGPVEATLTGKSDAFVLLTGGRADRSRCEADGTFHILGDGSVGEALADVLFAPLKYL